ncbi:MAG: 2-oxoacid:acceptor oxidoreductase family protein [Crenarchaeota archaeon]|nr:2-oxoacid:acceptor oxidoreductase family protein [Thermoproteota archaeon]MDW8034052.1 2-oxoacid:acceptor oxidoreductase family protein [Nitrososphaerota archaeon]
MKKVSKIIEIKWQGRGGQGVVLANQLIGMALFEEGKHIQTFPDFGPERTGGPVRGYTRFSEEPIDVHSFVYEPDILAVIDPYFAEDPSVYTGLKPTSIVVVNSAKKPHELIRKLDIKVGKFGVVDALRISKEVFGTYVFNTPVLGGLVKLTEMVRLETLEKLIMSRFPGKLGELNIQALRRGFEEVVA